MRLVAWLGSALAAAGAALFVICLTRVLAFLNPPNSVFLLTGLGASGLAVGALIAHRLCWLPTRALGVSAGGAALAAGLCLVSAVVVVGTAMTNSGLANVAVTFAACAAAGVPLAAVYAGEPRAAASLFAWQLLGGAAAAIAAPALLDRAGPLLAWPAAAALLAVSGLVFLAGSVLGGGRTRDNRDEATVEEDEGAWLGRMGRWVAIVLGTIATVVALAALPLQAAAGWLRIDPATVNSDKSLFTSIRDDQMRERVEQTHWDSVSRTDVTQPADTDQVLWAYQDGGVAGLMYRTGTQAAAATSANDIGNLPFQMQGAHDKVLVIGAGTGEDVLLALAAGAKEVVATEVSPGMLAAAQQYASFNGDWLNNPAVRLVDQDGRAYLRASGEQFDLIYVSLTPTGVAQPGGPVTGSYLYTMDAFGDYMDHLRQDGRLVLKLHGEEEFVRAFNTAFQASRRRGVDPVQSLRRLLGVNNQPVADRGDSGIVLPLLIVRKTPYLEDEAHAAYDVIRQTPFTPIYLPFLENLSPFSAIADESMGPAALEASAPYDVRPVSDTSPFFFEFEKGFPWVALLAPLLPILLAGGAAWLTRRPSAEAIESMDEVPEDALAFLEDDVPWRFALFAALTAAGFALAQVALLQRLPLLLGDPRLTQIAGYGVFLAAAAVGSILASRVAARALRPAIGWAGLAAGIFAVATIELLPMASTSFRGSGVLPRLALGAAFSAPLGLCFGVPFASAIRMLAGARRGGWAPFLFAASVLGGTFGSFFALTLGIAGSFNVALALGAACLFGAFLMAGLRYIRIEEREEPAPEPTAPVDHSAFQRKDDPTSSVTPLAEAEAGRTP